MKSRASIDPKQLKWDKMAARVDKIVDGLGKHVDRNIKEAVIALNLLGINTTASCQGHPNWATGGPYIDIESKKSEPLNKEFDKIKKSKKPDKKKIEKIRNKVSILNLKERRKLIPYLEEFYKDRVKDVPYDVKLNISALGWGWSRLESQGVDFQEYEKNIAKKRKRLSEFQAEMRAFSGFLKDKFFN